MEKPALRVSIRPPHGAVSPRCTDPIKVALTLHGALRQGSPTFKNPFERTMVTLTALRAARGNVKSAAQSLGISRQRLYRMLDEAQEIDLATLRRDGEPGSQ